MAPPDSTIYIVSLNKTPKRAMALLQRVIKSLEPQHRLIHLANTTFETINAFLSSLIMEPQILICSSQWTAEEQHAATTIAQGFFPNIESVHIPPGLDIEKGGDAIVQYLVEAVGKACGG